MSKKKTNLSKDMEKVIEALDTLVEYLRHFSQKCSDSMKKHVGVSVEDRDEIIKAINETSEEAHKLSNKIETIKRRVTETKSLKSSRFAKIIVSNFLEADNNLLIN